MIIVLKDTPNPSGNPRPGPETAGNTVSPIGKYPEARAGTSPKRSEAVPFAAEETCPPRYILESETV